MQTTRATARLPGLDIEVTHRRTADGDAEQFTVNLTFAAFGRTLQSTDPFTFWAHSAQAAWLPWLEAARMMGLPPTHPWAIAR
jgi:hypothetical protein